MLKAIDLAYAFRHYYPILTKKKINSEFLGGTYSFIHSQIFILGYKMLVTTLSAWDTARNKKTRVFPVEKAKLVGEKSKRIQAID